MRYFVVWSKPNNEIYYRSINGSYKNYEVGMTNSYGHSVVLVIKDSSYKRNFSHPIKRFLRKSLMWIYEKI